MVQFIFSLAASLVWNVASLVRATLGMVSHRVNTFTYHVQGAAWYERNGMPRMGDAIAAHRASIYGMAWLRADVERLTIQLDRERYEREAAERHANNLLNIMRETREREAQEWAQHVREVVRERVERAMLLDDVRNIVRTLRDNVETAETYASVTASAMQLEAFDYSFENLEELREKLEELAHVGNESFEELEEELYNAYHE